MLAHLRNNTMILPTITKRIHLTSFFILCSVKRSEKVYLSAYKSLKLNFPRYELLATLSVDEISRIVCWGGLQGQKATAAKQIIEQLIENFDRPTLTPLKKMSDKEAEVPHQIARYREENARCVMLYSLDRQVFPIDSHCWRIPGRLGWSNTGQNVADVAADHLQDLIPPDLRFSLHVNMVSHGRKICKARSPLCQDCVIMPSCRKIGVVTKS